MIEKLKEWLKEPEKKKKFLKNIKFAQNVMERDQEMFFWDCDKCNGTGLVKEKAKKNID